MPSSAKPRLALCLEYPIQEFGGTEVLVAELVRGLSPDYALTLVSADPSLAGTWVEPHLQQHVPWLSERGEDLADKLQAAGVQLAHFHCGGSFAWSMRRLNASPILRVRERGIRCLTTNHGFFSPLEGYCAQYRPAWVKAALFPAAWLAKLQVLRAVECEIAVSQYDCRALRRWYWPCRGRFRQIYHAQLHEADRPPPPDAPRRRTVLCVGTFGLRKGQPLLADAFGRVAAEHPEWDLVFAGRIGEPAVWREVEESVATRGLQARVRRLEGLSHAEVAEWMRTSEIFVLPSLFEGLGLSLQEALFQGCACLASRSGGPEDLILPEQNGLLVPKNDVPALAAALSRLMGDPALRQRLRERGPASILERGMTAEEMVRRHRSLYQSLLRES